MAEYRGTISAACAGGKRARTRIGSCDVEPGLIVGLFATPVDATFPVSETEFNTQLPGNIASGKIIPIMGIEGAVPTGGDLATNTTNYGTNIPVVINPPSIPYQILSGGACLEKELAKLNKGKMRFMWIEASGRLWRHITVNAAGEEVAMGFKGIAMFYPTLAQNNTTPYMKYFNVAYGAVWYDEWLNKDLINSDPNAQGLMGIKLEAGDPGTARIVGVCSGQDYGVEIAAMLDGVATDMFIPTPTTVAINPDTGLVTISPAGAYRIAGAEALDAMNVIGFDGLPETTEITAAP